MFRLFSLVFLALSASAAPEGGYHPEALRQLIQYSREVKARGSVPVVLFDLDDTLIDTRERNMRILQDFGTLNRGRFPVEAARIDGLEEDEVHFLTAETLHAVGVDSPEVVAAAQSFWLERFFTNEYCSADRANAGAAEYLRKLEMAGAKLVFLTGRDSPRMEIGTRESLGRNHFPAGAELILKPDARIDDLVFKESQYAAVAGEGQVIGFFENEPANLNSMARAFPGAEAVFLDTIHSPKPEVPVARAKWVRDFRF